jgi:predicted Rossmann-fold nucleotide-binding protein
MDEFFESMTLMQTEKTDVRPVVLMGSEFWRGLVAWMRATMLEAYGNISPGDMDMFRVVDDPGEAVDHIRTTLEGQGLRFPLVAASQRSPGPKAAEVSAEGTRFGQPPVMWPVRHSGR